MKLTDAIFMLALAIAVPAPASAASSKAAALPLAPKKWTVMVYMNGKSNLEGNSFARLNNLEFVGSGSDMNIVAEYSRMRGQKDDFKGDGDWTGARRYYIIRDNDPAVLASPVLKRYDSVDSGDWRRVAEFIKWAKTNFPAERYILLYRFHGGGWADPVRTKAMNYDDETGSFTATAEMPKIFREAGPVDLYLSDVCMMQSLEVLYGLKDYVKVAVGAENLSYGFSYYRSFSAIAANPGVSTRALAKRFLEDYKNIYASGGLSYQLSAVDASALADMSTELRRWTGAVMRVNDRAAVLAAKKGVKRAYLPQYADLRIFAQLLLDTLDKSRPGAAELRSETAALFEALDNRLLLGNITMGKTAAGLGGVTVYVPNGENDDRYLGQHAALPFGKSSGWTDFARYLSDIK